MIKDTIHTELYLHTGRIAQSAEFDGYQFGLVCVVRLKVKASSAATRLWDDERPSPCAGDQTVLTTRHEHIHTFPNSALRTVLLL